MPVSGFVGVLGRQVDRETDFACVLQGDDGKEEITWSYNTRCWVSSTPDL